jgi:hypothetical protein
VAIEGCIQFMILVASTVQNCRTIVMSLPGLDLLTCHNAGLGYTIPSGLKFPQVSWVPPFPCHSVYGRFFVPFSF